MACRRVPIYRTKYGELQTKLNSSINRSGDIAKKEMSTNLFETELQLIINTDCTIKFGNK